MNILSVPFYFFLILLFIPSHPAAAQPGTLDNDEKILACGRVKYSAGQLSTGFCTASTPNRVILGNVDYKRLDLKIESKKIKRIMFKYNVAFNNSIFLNRRFTSDSSLLQTDVNTLIIYHNYHYQYRPHESWSTGLEMEYFLLQQRLFVAVGISFIQRSHSTIRTEGSYSDAGYENIQRISWINNTFEFPISLGLRLDRFKIAIGLSFPIIGHTFSKIVYDNLPSTTNETINYNFHDLFIEQRLKNLNLSVAYEFNYSKFKIGPLIIVNYSTSDFLFIHYGISFGF